MFLGVLIEEQFNTSPFGQGILEGFYSEVKKKRIRTVKINNISDIINVDKCKYCVIGGENLAWLHNNILACQQCNVHPIVLGRLTDFSDITQCSYVYSNINHSMEYLTGVLKTNNLSKYALYGINPYSLADINCVQYFVKETNLSLDDYVYNSTSLEDCFENIYANINKYDSIICLNDFAAISLVKNLRKLNFDLNKLFIIGISDTKLSQFYKKPISSLSIKSQSIGKAAITLYETLSKNTEYSSIHIEVKSTLFIRGTDGFNTNYLATYNSNGNRSVHQYDYRNTMSEDEVYEPSEIYCDEYLEMLYVELMLKNCSELDLNILFRVMLGLSYMDIADECFISFNTVKYHITKMMTDCKTLKKIDFINLLNKYIDVEKIKSSMENS